MHSLTLFDKVVISVVISVVFVPPLIALFGYFIAVLIKDAKDYWKD